MASLQSLYEMMGQARLLAIPEVFAFFGFFGERLGDPAYNNVSNARIFRNRDVRVCGVKQILRPLNRYSVSY